MSRVEEILLFDCEQTGPIELKVPGGRVQAFSARGPGKDRNEDALLVAHFEGGAVLAIADGMGGMNAGERASRVALETLVECLQHAEVGELTKRAATRHTMFDAIETANRRVLDLNLGAGTTLAALILSNKSARPVHVGDSVAVHVGQRGRIKTWTVAHSPTGYAVEAGILDEAEALHHEYRHLLSNFVGSAEMRIEFGPAITVGKRDTLLVASDGLVDNLTPDEVVSSIRKGSLESAAAHIARLARRRMLEPQAFEPSKPDDLSFLLYRRDLADGLR